MRLREWIIYQMDMNYLKNQKISGTILDSLDSSEINVVYYYKLKEYIVKTNVINDGGTISGQGERCIRNSETWRRFKKRK